MISGLALYSIVLSRVAKHCFQMMSEFVLSPDYRRIKGDDGNTNREMELGERFGGDSRDDRKELAWRENVKELEDQVQAGKRPNGRTKIETPELAPATDPKRPRDDRMFLTPANLFNQTTTDYVREAFSSAVYLSRFCLPKSEEAALPLFQTLQRDPGGGLKMLRERLLGRLNYSGKGNYAGVLHRGLGGKPCKPETWRKITRHAVA
nr:hypothetical protein Iba_chr02bCG14780 [Ipomoea batatas]